MGPATPCTLRRNTANIKKFKLVFRRYFSRYDNLENINIKLNASASYEENLEEFRELAEVSWKILTFYLIVRISGVFV